MNLSHLDLFSGIGGFSIAAEWAGFTTIAFCEKEPYAQKILQQKFGAVMADASRKRIQHHRSMCGSVEHDKSSRSNSHDRQPEKNHCQNPILHPDIFTLNGTDYAGVDLVTGGFPCQPYSVAGKRKGKDDDRAIWPEMLRVISEARPAWVLGENVAGIINMELDRVLSDLENIGYACWPLVIPAVATDAKHRRDRVWILGANTRCNHGAKPERQHEWSKNSFRSGGNGLESGDDVGNTRHVRGKIRYLEHQEPSGQEKADNALPSSSIVSHPNRMRPQGRNGQELRECGGKWITRQGGSFCSWQSESEWFAESGMGRTSHGIPNRTHRLKGLDNAIVPQVAYQILKGMAELLSPSKSQSGAADF